MSTPLSALSSIISSGIATIESTYANHGTSFPSMDEPFQPGPLDEDESLCATIDYVTAAAAQLIALIKPTPLAVFASATSVCNRCYVRLFLSTHSSDKFYLPAGLQVVVEANIPEILREAGAQVSLLFGPDVYSMAF
jgi:hypothetical protein